MNDRLQGVYLFSTLIKCKECGWSFRRTVRTYKNTYVRWVCSGHNGRGADNCPNAVTVDEDELIEVLQEYFAGVLKAKKNVIRYVTHEFQRVYKAKDENLNYEKELTTQLAKLQKTRQKYMDMYADDLISREELNDKIGGMRKEIERLENELKMVSYHLTKGEQLETILHQTFKEIEDIADVRQMTNAQLKRIIQKIEVDKDGNVDIYLRLFGDLGLDETVLIRHDETGGKRPRVIKPKDPKEKVPAWRPRKTTPCAVRVYHYKNPDTELLQSLLRQRGIEPYVSATDYAVCYESHTDISAEEFQNEVCFLNLSDRLGFPLHPWEVLEIDDGLYPYFFYLDDKLRLHFIHFRKEDCGRNTLTGFSATEVAQWRE